MTNFNVNKYGIDVDNLENHTTEDIRAASDRFWIEHLSDEEFREGFMRTRNEFKELNGLELLTVEDILKKVLSRTAYEGLNADDRLNLGLPLSGADFENLEAE